jgi:hypothetical protein
MTNYQLQNTARIMASIRAKQLQKHIGENITTSVFGRMVTGKVIAIHPFGVVDIELPSGNCVRVSGISFDPEFAVKPETK